MSLHGIKFKPLALGTNKLAADYIAGQESATVFFGGRFDDLSRLRVLSESVDKRLDRNLVSEVLEGQRTFPLTGNGKALLDRFVEQKGFCVVTGQQPVLFGGPLYVLYKCVSVIKAAQEYENLLGRPVLPIFWTAGEDHDLAEASSVGMPGLDNQTETLGLTVEKGNYKPLCQIELGSGLGQVRAQLETIFPDNEYRQGLFTILDQTYTEHNDYGHAFSELIVRIFASHGLFVVDACSPQLRRGASRLLEREIFDSAASASLFDETSERIERAGYNVQVRPQDNDTGLFVLREGRRVKLQRDGAQYQLKGVGEKLTADELREMLQNAPELFSPGVRVRPLVEAELFGTLSYLAGPGEVAYYAQLGPLYGLRGLQMPVIRPRMSGVLLEAKIEKVLDKYGVTVETLEQGAGHTAEQILHGDEQWKAIATELDSIRTELESGFQRIEKQLDGIDPTMKGPSDKTLRTMTGNIDKLQGKLVQAAKRRNETLLTQLDKACSHLWPKGGRQERETSWLYYMVRYGEPLIDWLLEQN